LETDVQALEADGVEGSEVPDAKAPWWASPLRFLTVALLIGAVPEAAPAQDNAGGIPSATLRVGRGAESIRVDGILDEAVWRSTDSIESLREVEPVEGRVPRSRTVVRVIASPRELVVGVLCWLAADQPLIGRVKGRDADLDDEDYLSLVLDTYRDGRSGYQFTIGPAGARTDGLITNQGEGTNDDWDGIWEAASVVTDSVWSLEIRIPVRGLSFDPRSDAWAFNVERRIESALEVHRWAAVSKDRSFGQTTGVGTLIGLPRFDLGRGLTVRPSTTASVGIPEPGAPTDAAADVSLDVEQRVTANLLGALTINTDFAETEVDARRTNLTRFPLFFPEKRSFFLEGSDGYEFGLGLGTDLVPFFSRRIGLLSGREVPLRAGAKLVGQIGGTRIGALAARTGELAGLTPGATLAAVRVRRNVLAESSIGAILTVGDPRGGSGWTGGFDATYRTSRLFGDKNFLVGAWVLAAGGDSLPEGDRAAWGVKVDYPNDLFDIALTWKRIGDRFDPGLGFVPRRGVNLLSVGAEVAPRPKRFGIRQMFFEPRLFLATDLAGQWESYRFQLVPLNLQFETGDQIELEIAPQGERLTGDFEVADGVVIPAGSYRFSRYTVEARSASRRVVSADVEWTFGTFYRGTLNELEIDVNWRPIPGLSVGANAERSVGHLPEGRFAVTLVGSRWRYGVTPDLELNSLVQFDTDSRRLGANTRLRWLIDAGTELFVIYNHNVRDRLDRWSFESNQLAAKLRFAIRP